MKWMIVLGLTAGVLGGLYRWFVAPEDPQRWGIRDVSMGIVGIVGVMFFALGLILFGLKWIFR